LGLDVVELVMTIEEQYGLSISDADARAMRSVGDLHAYILAHAQPVPDAEAAWSWLRNTIEAEFGVPRERITREAWIVRDLGIS
jgi:hypothetical protein